MVVTPRRGVAFAVAAVLLIAAIGLAGEPVTAGTPVLPARNYDKERVLVRGDEAVALTTATSEMRRQLKSKAPKESLTDYYAEISKAKAPSGGWTVTFFWNDAATRGGGTRIVLDSAGTRVLAIEAVE